MSHSRRLPRTHLAAARFVLAAGVAVFGCGEGEPNLPPSVELGTGVGDFESVSDGGDILVIQGPQGGHHLLGSIRVTGLDPGNAGDLSDPANPITAFTVETSGARIDLGVTYRQGLRRIGGGVYEMVGRLVILDIADDSEVVGETLLFAVSVTDIDGTTVTDGRTVTAIPHPDNM